jgi:hypothetical protein
MPEDTILDKQSKLDNKGSSRIQVQLLVDQWDDDQCNDCRQYDLTSCYRQINTPRSKMSHAVFKRTPINTPVYIKSWRVTDMLLSSFRTAGNFQERCSPVSGNISGTPFMTAVIPLFSHDLSARLFRLKYFFMRSFLLKRKKKRLEIVLHSNF